MQESASILILIHGKRCMLQYSCFLVSILRKIAFLSFCKSLISVDIVNLVRIDARFFINDNRSLYLYHRPAALHCLN